MAAQRRIKERGELSVKIVTYTFAILYIVISIVPLLWMISSSMKDGLSVYSFPPKWLPKVPQAITVTLSYDGQELQKETDYELDAMKAIWFTWKKLQNDPIGSFHVIGVRDGKTVYEASMPSYKFTAGRPEIVPTQLFTDAMMRLKLPIIHEKRLTAFQWYDGGKAMEGAPADSPELSDTAAKVKSTLAESKYVKGKMAAIQQSSDWARLSDNYIVLWEVSGSKDNLFGFQHFLWNSVLVTGATILSHIVIGGMAGYALSHLVSRRTATGMTLFFVATIMIPEIAILVPLYLTMQQLGLVDSLWGIILPHTAWGIVIFLYKGFFDQLPYEIIQAARIDGASEFGIFGRIVIPMSVPIFTVVSVMTFISVWNEFLWPMVIARDPAVWTFTVALNDFQNRQSMGANVLMASLVVSTIPLMIVFVTCQKLIEKGVSFTGVKG